MAVNYVKFQRGSQAAYDKLLAANRVNENTLYFIYSDENNGKLYLGDRLISTGSNVSSLSLSDLTDVLIQEIKENSFLIQNAEGKWYNASLEEVATLIKTEITVEDDGIINLTINNNHLISSHAKKGPEGGAQKGPSADAEINNFGDSLAIRIPVIAVDEYGHTTALEDKTLSISLPSLPEFVDNNTTYELKYEEDNGIQFIRLYDNDNNIISAIDASIFIKDGMLENVSYNEETNELTFTWNTSAGKTENIVKISDIIDPYSAGHGVKIENNIISINLNADEKNLIVDENGLKTNFNLDDYVTDVEAKVNNGIRFINQEEINKLAALSLNNGDITISGSVEAAQVKGLYSIIKNIVTNAPGLEDFDSNEEGIQQALGIEIGAQKNFISTIDENKFTVTEGKLFLKENYITNKEVGDLSQLIRNGDFSQFVYDENSETTLINEINYINQRLSWGEITE